MGRSKKPGKEPKSQSQFVKSSKRPRSVEGGKYEDCKPVWKVAAIDLEGPFGWGRLKGDEAAIVQQRLKFLEAMTWKEILLGDGDDNHRIDVDRLSKGARKRLVEINQDDADPLVSLRVRSRERIWGILDGCAFKILWWDPNHHVYPVSKRKT
jgi:hypothetical protein